MNYTDFYVISRDSTTNEAIISKISGSSPSFTMDSNYKISGVNLLSAYLSTDIYQQAILVGAGM